MTTVLDSQFDLPSVEEQRRVLRNTRITAPRRHRILFVGAAHDSTDIVAVLQKALEAIGHTVFTLNTRLYPQLLDRSSGGNGPTFLRVPPLHRVLDRFDPQFVVLCGGSLALTDSGASELASRGVVSIGMTLSDPDVQDSVLHRLRNFDVHTTNTVASLERYRSLGVTNTHVMPFGIDKSFVLNEAPVAPEHQADVICIGHAVDRPERNTTMSRLAKLFDVQVYGNGWDLPSSGPVRGDALLSAARGGRIHINFPQTRAGFAEVKRGVFESIGSGGLIATTVFDEMATLFEYDSEVVGYSDDDDLVRQLTILLRDPERLELMRRRAFARLASNHLYEHRWLDLFAAIEATAEREDTQTASRVRSALHRSAGPPKHVIVSGYFGARNVGDDLLLDAVADAITRSVPGANVVVAGVSGHTVELEHGLQAFTRANTDLAAHWASRASALVLGPGGLWNDYSIVAGGGVAGMLRGATLSPSHLAQLAILVKARGGALHGFGLGAGPLAHPEAQSVVRFTGLLADSITVRDEDSRAILESIPGWTSEVVVAPDPVYALTLPPPRATNDSGYIALNLREWPEEPEAARRVARATLRAAEEAGLAVLGVPMQSGDHVLLTRLLADSPIACVLPVTATQPEVLGALGGAHAVVAMRLHTNLVGHRYGRPCVGITYDPKVRRHFDELGRSQFALPLATAEVVLAERIALATSQPLDRRTQDAVTALEARSRAALDRLADAIASGDFTPDVARPIRGSLWAEGPESTRPYHQVDLSHGVFRSGNLREESATVEVKSASIRTRATFNMTATAPRKDDYASFCVSVPQDSHGETGLKLLVQNSYRHDPAMAGRLVIEVLIDGNPLFHQDVAVEVGANEIDVSLPWRSVPVELEVRLRALRDCESWNWGPAVSVSVSGVTSYRAGSLVGWRTSQVVVPSAGSTLPPL